MSVINEVFNRARRRREERIKHTQARQDATSYASRFRLEPIESRLLLSGELAVTQFEPTDNGFNVQFNQAVDSSVLSLYDVEAGTLGPADVTVVGNTSGNIKGSLIASNNIVSFIRDGGVLAPDTYTVTLRSADNGFNDLTSGLLDGNANGVTGDDYITDFTVNPLSSVVVAIPDLARGPGQIINIPGGNLGIPVTLSDATSVTSVSLTLNYDANLLKISQVSLASTLPNGSTLQSDLSVAGILTLTINSPSAIGGSNVELVRLLAEIPHTAAYGTAGVLDISNISINNGALSALGDDGVQAVAYFGEATGNQRYTALDGQRILRVAAGLDSGFEAYANLAPSIIANITGNGSVNLLDASRVLQEVVGLDRVEIQAITPVILSNLANDTGLSSLDRITFDATLSGTVADDGGNLTSFNVRVDNGSFIDVTGDLLGNNFSFSRIRLEEIIGSTLTDGAHSLQFQASDNGGNLSTLASINFTLDTIAPAIDSFELAASSDTGIAGDNITAATVVALTGSAESGITLNLGSTQVLATGNGTYQIPGVALNLGGNPFTLTSRDIAGNDTQRNLAITRQQGQLAADVVLQWNQIALDAIRLTVSDPPIASRILAMVSLAQYDTLAAIEDTPAYLVKQVATGPIALDAALAKAAHTVLHALFPSQRANFDSALNTLLNGTANGAAKDNALALGLSIGSAILAIRANDGSNTFIDFPGSEQVGQWRPTAPMFDVADEPQWGDVTPFAISSGDQLRPLAPPTLDSAGYAAAVEEVRNLGSATSTTRTADQTQTAQFWADGKGSYTPAGHWNQIAQQMALSQGNSLGSNVRLFAQLNVALADSSIAAWDAKYTYGLWRPIDAIHNADLDTNPATTLDTNWTPLLITPPHPEYVSGHSTYSAAAAQILAAVFGDNTAFSTTAFTLPGVTRNFTSFTQAAQEAGRSRIFGGIHYEFTNQAGQQLGQQVANQVLQRFTLSQDIQAPAIIANAPPATTNANITLTGQIVDNISGVQSAQFKIDNGAFQNLTLDPQGQFSIATSFVLDGSNDGLHTITISAKDAANNSAPLFVRTFTLDTQLPIINLTSIADSATIDAASRLTGTATPTGSALTVLSYKFDNATARSIVFDSATGGFDIPLFIGSLSEGNHTLTLTAKDGAGNQTTLTRNVTLIQAIPFQLSAITPTAGSRDVGVTFKPQIIFSRSVDPATLTNNSLYATGPDGQKIAAAIVPAADGTFAWLFFNAPLAGGSTITINVNGELIRSIGDQTKLDADGNGTAGGVFTASFTTVSTTSIPGTKVVGKVVDPGPDLEPMTFDDIRRGPDGISHTADDVFLNPIAHAKVFILGQESNFVFTDANGDFELNNVPVGNVKVAVDGRTATNAPAGIFFPEMVMDANLQPGITQTIMGSMGTLQERQANVDRKEVYLPRVATDILQVVSNTQTTTITVDETSAPNLTDAQRNVLTLTVEPGSAVGENGQVLNNVQIGISTVPPELVRDMLPPGVLQHTFDITIQAPGVVTFAEPLQITFPNVFNAAPGTKLNILSFDHTTGRLVINGTATVSADGLTVVADPGSGIEAPGWHGVTPPGDCNGAGGPPPLPPPPTPNDTMHEQDSVALAMIFGETGTFPKQTWTAPDKLPDTPPIPPQPPGGWTPPPIPEDPPDKKQPYLKVTIEVDGPLATFIKKTGNLDLISQSFTLQAGSGEIKTFGGIAKTYAELFGADGFKNLTRDELYGSKVKITEETGKPDGSKHTEKRTIYLYRWVDVIDAEQAKNKTGSTAAFFKTLADGAGDFVRTKFVNVLLPESVTTSFESAAPFDVGEPSSSRIQRRWFFDPPAYDPATAGQFNAPIAIKVDDPKLPGGTVGQLTATGKSSPITKLSINLDDPATGYKAELKRVILSLAEVYYPGPDGEPGKAGVDDDGNGSFNGQAEYGAAGSDDVIRTLYEYTGHSGFDQVFTAGPDGRSGKAGVDDDGDGAIDMGAGERGAPGSDDLAVWVKRDTAREHVDFQFVSDRFQELFAPFMPHERTDPGPDGVPLTRDDQFTAAQLAALDARIASEANALLAEVQADFADISAALTFQRINAGADVVMDWKDLRPGLYGGTNRDLNLVKMRELIGTQGRTDPITGNTYNLDISQAAQQWALAQYLNEAPAAIGEFAVGINVNFTSNTTTFAQYIANTVSHELAHTYSLNEGYFSQGDVRDGMGVRAGGGTAEVNANGNAFPYDIMSNGQPGDPNLTFKGPTVQLLKAASGLQDNFSLPITQGLDLWRDAFNLRNGRYPDGGHDQNGIREESPNPSTVGEISLHEGDDLFFGFGGEVADIGMIGADGPLGMFVDRSFTLVNDGRGPLTLSSVSLDLGTAGFSILSTAPAGTVLQPAETTLLAIRFDPSVAGASQDGLTIMSDAGTFPIFHLALEGLGITNTPLAKLDVIANNNLGGLPVPSGSAQRPNLATITNDGAQPLLISGINIVEGGGSFSLLGVPANLAANPISLNFGESFSFGVSFDPDHVGLIRGLIDVTTNDPTQPTLRLSAVGTGLPNIIYPEWGDDFVAIEMTDVPGSIPLRAQSDALGNFSFFLASQAAYHLVIFDPVTGLVSHGYGATGVSGTSVDLTRNLVFLASTAPDTDFDGLPDDAEFAVGTGLNVSDTDRDGLSDFTEIQQGLDPLGGRAFPTGIIATLSLQGEAKEIVVQGAIANPAQQTAYLATGSYGLAIVDVSQFDEPILLGQLDLAGDAVDVAVDSKLQIAAVASGTGLHLVDVSNPTAPSLLRTVNANATQVEFADGLAYATVGTDLRSYDPLTGNQIQSLTLSTATLTSLAREGAMLYVVDAALKLSAVDIGDFAMAARGSVTLTDGGGKLFVGNGIAYIAAANRFNGGFSTVNVADPDNLTLISGSDVPTNIGAPGTAVVANGSGLALAIGSLNFVFGGFIALDVMNIADPTNTNAFLTRINLPAAPLGVAIGSGIAFIAGGTADLQIVNYVSFDGQGQAPTINLTTSIADVDPVTGGVQVTEGSFIPLRATTFDDVQVRIVELLVNGTVVSNSVSFPFDLSAIALGSDPNAPTVSVQARATDTGGNSALSNILSFDLVPDTFGPLVQSVSPAEGQKSGQGLRTVTVRFNEALAEATVTAANFELRDTTNQVITPQSIQLRNNGRTVVLTFAPLAVGDYSLHIDKAQVTDLAGNAMGSGDFSTQFTLLQATISWIGGNGFWDDLANWSTGVLPGVDDIVLIESPLATITHRFDTTTIRGLIVPGNLVVSGGILTITDSGQIDGSLSLTSGGQLTGTGNVTVNGTFTWTGGGITGAGSISIAATGTLVIGGDATKSLDQQRILNNAGTATWSGLGDIFVATGAIINNSGSFTAQNDRSFFNLLSNGTFNNSGVFTKNTGTGTTTIGNGVAFNNSGTVNVLSGTLSLAGGGASSSTFNISTGAFVSFDSGTNYTLNGATAFNGGGTFRLNSGSGTVTLAANTSAQNVEILGGALTVAAALSVDNFKLNGGTLNGAGTLTVANSFAWTGGTMGGAGVTTVTGTTTISGGSTHDLTQRTLNLNGVTTWTNVNSPSQGQIRLGNGATINNSVLFQDQTTNATSINAGLGGIAPVFNNLAGATYRKSGAVTTTISAVFNNNTVSEIQAGILSLQGGGASNSSFDVAATSFVSFDSLTYTLNTGATITGSGVGRVNGGTLAIAAPVSVENFALNSGTLNGAGTLTVANSFAWTSGVMSGAGATTISGTATISSNGLHDLTARTLNLNGTTTWTNAAGGSAGAIRMGTGAVINNAGLFQDQIAFATTFGVSLGGAASTFNNLAGSTYRKNGATTTTISAVFNNNAVSEIQAGILSLTGGGASSNLFSVSAGSFVSFDVATYTLNTGATISGTGAGRVNGGTLAIAAPVSVENFALNNGSVNGAGTLTVVNTFAWTGGTMSGAGATTISGTAAISGNGLHDLITRTLNLNGATTWTNAAGGGVGAIRMGTGAVINNAGLFQDQITVATTLGVNLGGAASTFNNLAGSTYRKNGATTTTISAVFNNNAVSEIQAGILSLTGGGASSNLFSVSAGSFVSFDVATYTLNTGATISGTGAGRVNGGTLAIAAAVSVENFALNSGTLNGAGTLTVANSFAWTSGAMSGAGATTISGTATISSNGLHDLTARTLNLNGTTTWTNAAGGSAGAIRMGSGAVINNAGLFQDQITVATTLGVNLGGAASTFNNLAGATYRKNGATTTTISAVFNNHAVSEIQAGILSLQGGGASSSSFDVATGTFVSFDAAIYTLDTGAAVSGSGVGRVNGGTLAIAAPVSVENFALNSGTLNGAGTLTVANSFVWTSGAMSGAGATTISGTATISTNGLHDLTTRTLNLNGTTTWTNAAGGSAGAIRMGSGAVINNAGLFQDQITVATTLGVNLGGAASTFNNVAGGTYRKSGAVITTIGIAHNNAGTMELQNGTLNFGAAYTQTAGTTLLVGGSVAGGNTFGLQGGTLTGAGTITANVTNNALIEIGGAGAAATLNITGNYTQTALGTLRMEIGGLAAGTQFDRLMISGSATLAGTLDLLLINAFDPLVGDLFPVLTFGSRVNQFTNVTGTSIGGSKTLSIVYNATNVTIDVV